MLISDTWFRAAVVFLAAVAMVFALHAASAVFAPLVLAVVIGIVLSPITELGKRFRLSPVWNALIGLCVTLGLLSVLVILLEPPVSWLFESAPVILFEVRQAISSIQRWLADLVPFASGPATASVPLDSDTIPTLTDALLLAPGVAAQIMIFAGGLFFFLLSRENLYDAIGKAVPGLTHTRVLRVERRVSTYFLTITVINMCFGAIVALAMHIIGMPSAILWGVGAAAMNFILYLGPLMVALALAMAGAMVFGGPFMFLPPVVFVALNIAEGQFITPALVGRQMHVNPLLVFFALVFGLWLWGPIGGFIAIPLLLTISGLWEQAHGTNAEDGAFDPAAPSPDPATPTRAT